MHPWPLLTPPEASPEVEAGALAKGVLTADWGVAKAGEIDHCSEAGVVTADWPAPWPTGRGLTASSTLVRVRVRVRVKVRVRVRVRDKVYLFIYLSCL